MGDLEALPGFCLSPLDDLGAQALKSLQRWEGQPQQGQNCLPKVVREPVVDAGDRRLIAPPTFPGSLEVNLLEHRRVEFHRGELRQSGPQILRDDAVILAEARRGKTVIRDDGGVGDVVGGDGVGVVEGGVGATHAKHREGGVGGVEGGVGDVRDVGTEATVGGELRGSYCIPRLHLHRLVPHDGVSGCGVLPATFFDWIHPQPLLLWFETRRRHLLQRQNVDELF